jgi:predicted aminopeptidase
MLEFNGQMEVLNKRRPISQIISDDDTDEKLRERLELVLEARKFAVDELLLPENDSYRSYSDLERDFVVWNVFAAPEFSLTPKQWCYPIAGCVAYRGYFAEAKATKKARSLEKNGLDVFVGGVAAYSTLGRFDDPVLNTMMRWSDANLIRTLFHELAHQKLYVSGDTAFNESFATAVAEFGMARWHPNNDSLRPADDSGQTNELLQTVRILVAEAHSDLERIYESGANNDLMRQQKRTTLDTLSADAQAEIAASGLSIQNWLAPPLNNARLVSFGVYESNLPAFRAIMETCVNDLACFYDETAELAELDFDERQERLMELQIR